MATAALRLGTHPRRAGRLALLDANGVAITSFPAGTTRQDADAVLLAAGYTLHADDTVTRSS